MQHGHVEHAAPGTHGPVGVGCTWACCSQLGGADSADHINSPRHVSAGWNNYSCEQFYPLCQEQKMEVLQKRQYYIPNLLI